MTERWLSGIIFDRRVPMEGKYIPTHASKAKKEAMSAARFVLPARAATPIAVAATAVMTDVLVSTLTLRDCRAPAVQCVIAGKSRVRYRSLRSVGRVFRV
jgi:hypothetical protein